MPKPKRNENGNGNGKGNGKNHNNGNGNGNNGKNKSVYQLGNCFMCGQESVPITKVPVFRQDVFGKNSHKVSVCGSCSESFFKAIKVPMNDILRNYKASYELTTLLFMKNIRLEDWFLKEIWSDPGPNYRYRGCIHEIIDAEEPRSCPLCFNENLTAHHPWKRSVFNENNYIVYLCRNCHDRIELYVNQGEAWALQDNIIGYKMGIDDVIMKLNGINISFNSTDKLADTGGIKQLI
ncbi:MAG: hypothetical protein WC534_00825 [Candidatus Paceibacterota bacterium]